MHMVRHNLKYHEAKQHMMNISFFLPYLKLSAPILNQVVESIASMTACRISSFLWYCFKFALRTIRKLSVTKGVALVFLRVGSPSKYLHHKHLATYNLP